MTARNIRAVCDRLGVAAKPVMVGAAGSGTIALVRGLERVIKKAVA